MSSSIDPKQPISRRKLLKGLGLAPVLLRSAPLFSGWFPGLDHGAGFAPPLVNELPFADSRFKPRYPAASPLEDVLRLVSPGFDEFVTEKYAAEIGAILEKFSRALRSPQTGVQALELYLDPALFATRMDTAKETPRQSNAGLDLLEAEFAAPESGREPFLKSLRTYLHGARVETAEFQIVALDEISTDPLAVSASIRYDFVLASAADQREQRIGLWHTEWVRDSAGTWTTRRWLATKEHVARFHGTGFVDITAKALGATNSYRDQLLRGVDHWRTVLDGACGIDVYGNSGVAVGDFNNDGLDDIYVCQPAGLPNRLYRNRGDGTFEDVSEAAGVNVLDSTASALFIDFDNRGLQDLLVVCASGPLLFRNQGGGKFVLASDAFHFALPPQGAFTHAAVADYDRDGKLDIYFCTYSYYVGLDQYHYPIPYFDARNGPANILMHNEGSGTFVECTKQAGLDAENDRYSFACAWCDFDADGLPDLMVANDFGRPNLYRNNGNGTFTVVSESAHLSEVGAGMSASWCDVDNNGKPDAYIANMWTAAGARISTQKQFHPQATEVIRALYRRHARGNSLFRNRGDGNFEDISEVSGAAMGRWSWCSDFFDFDHSGRAGLHIANGYISAPDRNDLSSFFWRQVVGKSPEDATSSQAYERGWGALNELIRSDSTWNGYERNVLYANHGDGTFSEVSGVLGLDFIEDSRSFALADLDHDGRLEIVLKNRNAPQLRILHNANAKLGQSILIQLRGTKSNRDAIGSTLTVQAGSLRQTKQLQAGSGFLAQHSKELHFGLGQSPGSIQVTVLWPSGAAQQFHDVPANHRIEIVEGEATFTAKPVTVTPRIDLGPAQKSVAEENPSTIETWLLQPLKAPEFSLADSIGARHELKTLLGSPVLLSFWSINSVSSTSQLTRFHQDWLAITRGGLHMLVINADEAEQQSRAKAFAERQHFDFPVLFATNDVAGLYNIIYRYLFDRRRDLGFPTSFLLDGQGMIVKVYQGVVEPATLLRDCSAIPATPQERVKKALPFKGALYQSAIQRNDFTYGVAFFQHGYLDQAAESFRQVIAAKPDDPEAYYNLGTLSLRRNELEEAQSYLNKAVELRPEYPEAWNNLGMLAAQQNRADDAIRNFQKSTSLRPTYAIAWLNLGNVYRRQGAVDQALDCLARAMKLQPDDPEIYYSLGMLYARENQVDRATGYLKKAIALRPNYAEALNNLGVLFVRNKDFSEAEQQFQASIRVAPDFDQSYINLARLYAIQGDKEKAKSALGLLIQRQPGNASAKQAMQMLESQP